MKKLFLLAYCTLYSLIQAQAQATFNTRDSVHINNINASVLLHGDMWWDPIAESARCEFPKNTGKHVGFVSALWMSGYDGSGQLHVASQTYRQDGNDYWPGPLDASGTLNYATSSDWAKFWKVRRSDIQYFQALSSHTTANTPTGILTWPAAGNAYAAGNGGVPLTISSTTTMAPFIDLNGNGSYEPLLGEYPDVKGDEAIWWAFSDNGPTHNNNNGIPLGVEVHAMSYAYARGTLIDNVVYYEYTVTNKSANTYNDFRIAQFSDADLGYFRDDFVGFDSAHRMSICYNGTADDGADGGHPANSYGIHCPVQGVTMIVLPGDVGTTYVPAGNFITYNNDFSAIGNPNSDTACNNYMRGKSLNGTYFTNDYQGPGLPFLPAGTGPIMRYFYAGDPADSAGNSECIRDNARGDRRTVLSTNDFTLAPGATAKIVMALVVTDTNQGGCPNVNFHDINVVADTAWGVYHNPPPPLPATINNIDVVDKISVYPIPAKDRLWMDIPNGVIAEADIKICNTLGQKIEVPISRRGMGVTANISALPTGIYYLIYTTTAAKQVVKFIRE